MNIKKVIILIIICLSMPILLNAQYLEWVRRYNGPMTNGDDVPSAITLDANGNIYLAGKSESGYNNSDFITIKYYPNGETAWVRRYNGLGNDFDRANAIVVDNNGNVYVTGMSYISAANSYDWLTVKYDGNGNLIWVKTYNGSGNADDEPKAIALDNTGNVYITGYTLSYDNWYDFTTIKYNKLNGDTIWVRHYDGPVNGYDQAVGIAIDNQNNVYVTGKSDGPDNWEDYATIKYSSAGTVQWVRRYSYGINSYDTPSSITVDNDGNIYVTGSSTISYYNNADCATIKYYPNGDTAWVRRYNGTANDWDKAKDIAVDTQGNVYITGYTYSRTNQRSYLTIKYNSSGTQQWVKIYDLPDTLSGYNEASALDLDNAGNIYVTGTIDNSINGRANDYGTIRYNPDGTQKWVTLYDNPDHDYDEAVAIAVDQSSNVYVTGTSHQNYHDDIVTIKYYQAGANDVGVDSIIYPPEQHLRLMPMRPCALVKNFGSSPQTNFPVVCSIIGPNNSLRYTNTQIIPYLADYDTVRVYFDTWIPTIRETCTVKMRTNLIGDLDPNNDQKTRITEITKAILILSEGFNDYAFPPLGWQNVIINGQVSDTWRRTSSNDYPFCVPYESTGMASYQSYDIPAGRMARLISPPINLGTQPKTCLLNFAMFHDPGYASYPDSVKIEYSTDGINFTQVSAVSRYRDYTPWDERWEEHSVELGTFTGIIYFGILAFSGYGRNMNIDLVQLYGTLPLFNDVAVDEIISQLPNQPAGLPITPIARIKNLGLNAQSNFPVVCSIISAHGVLRYTNTQNVPLLASGDTVQVNFASWTPDVEEVCMVKIRTLLANDENQNNDQKTKQIEIGSTLLLSEGFESTFPPVGWQSVIVYGYLNWERRTSNENPDCLPYEGLAMASYQSYWAWPPGSMARLISRPITLGPTPVPCTLKFFMYHDPWFPEAPDSVKIEYSIDGTNFTQVAAFARAIPEDSSYWIEHSVYLGTFSGTIYIGILAYSGYGNNMNIDYIRLIKFPQYTNDIGVDSIIQPTSTHTVNSQMTPIARVKNFGTATQTNFTVTCSIFGISSELLSKIQNTEQLLKSDLLSLLSNADYVVRYADTVRISSLASSETTRVNFRTWTPTIIEPCIIRIRTNLSIDQNPYNNFKDQITSITQYQYLIVEGFNDTTFPPPGWQSVIINGSYNWERKTSNEHPDCLPYEGTAMASYRSYSASAGSMARLISPPINPDTSPIPCTLKFFMYHDPGYSTDPDSVKIEYSTDGINFTRVTAFWRYAQTAGWKEHQVYLGTFSDTIYIGILAYSGYGNNMNIDYIRLYKEIPLANDVGVARIISPGSCHIPNTLMPITVWVKNYGNNPQTNFPVTCSVIGSAKAVRYTNTVYVTTTLAPNDSIQVNVGSYTPTISEICSLIVHTNLTNDQYPVNNRKTQLTDIDTHFSLLAEGFNKITFPPTGWQSVIVESEFDYNWERKRYNENPECYPYEGSGMASYPSYEAYEGDNARLISPAFNFGTVPIACSLKFNMYHDSDYDDCYDLVRIEYSTDGVNFIPVDSFFRYQPGPPAWVEHSIALGSFTGTFWLGIVGYSGYGNNINIDNVRLTGQAITNDVGIDAIIYPSTQHTVNTPMIPTARVKNYGSVNQNNFQVVCSIIGTGTEKMVSNLLDDTKTNIDNITEIIRYVDTLRISSLAANETTRVSFRSWIPTIPEQCTIKIRTNLASDQNPANDRKSVITEIIPATAVISPNGGEIWAGGTTKTIRWRAPQIYTRYVLLFSTNSGATYSDTIANNLLPTDSTYDWQVPMLNLRTCRIKLAIFDNLGNLVAQDASDADFTIDSEAPSIPILIAPANNAYLRDSMPCFWWRKSTDVDKDKEDNQAVFLYHKSDLNLKNMESTNFISLNSSFESGIANYQLQYAMNSSFIGAVQINSNDTFYQVPTRLVDTTYYWRVRAIDSAGNQSSWSSVWSFEIDTRIPNAPVLISPVNGVWLTNTNVIFNWSQVTFKDSPTKQLVKLEASDFITDAFDSPIRYILQIDTSRNFTNPIIDTTPYLYDTLTLSQARYFWRVRAYDLAGNQGTFSSADSFGIDYTPPSVPNLISPANNAILNDSFVRFYWNRSTDNVSGIKHYQIQIAKNINFTNAFDTTVVDTTLLRKLTDTTYYWRVKAYDRANNQSSWSATRSFEIDTRIPNAPVLISPINGIWLTNTNVIFNWSQVTFGDNNIDVIARSVSDEAISPLIAKLTSITNKGKPESEFTSPVRYILQVDTSRNFTNPITDTTSYLYDTLTLTQAKYFWRVRAYDLAGNQGVFSSADSFGIDYTPPSVPNLVLPANNAILNDSFVRFYWNRSTDNVSGIKHYQIQIAKNTNFTNAFDTTVVDTTLLRKLTDTTYYWRVKAYDRANNQSSWSATRSFEIDTRIPNAPVLISPVNGVWLTNTNVIFNWSQVSYDAKSPIRYILQVDTSRNFTNPIIDTTPYLYDTLTLSQARYFWRVRAYDLAGNQGVFSSADSFGIDYTPPSVPNLISPANNAILNDSFVRFYWNRSTDNVSGIKHYQIQIAKNSNFTNAFDTTVVDTTLLRKLTDTTYYWRVKAFDVANNQSSWSTVWSFTVQTTGIEELTNIKAPSIFYLYHNRPNPFSNITEITYSIPIATKVKVTIFSATGEEIVVLINCLQKPGLYSVIWNGHDNAQNICPNGIYFYRLETKEFQNTKKMLLLR